MTSVGGGCEVVRQELGVYVLGAIEPANRAMVDEHLRCCPRCREELAALAGLPALLRRVAVAQAVVLCGGDARDGETSAAVSGDLLGALLDRMAQARRLRMWRLAAAAAVLVTATAVGWGLQAWPAAPPPRAGSQWTATATAVNPVTRAGATVRYATRPWGTQLEVQVTGIPAGTTCQFWVTTARGQDVETGSWAIPAGQRDGWYPASAAVPVSGLRGFEVTSAGKTLVTVPAQPGRRAAAPSALAGPASARGTTSER